MERAKTATEYKLSFALLLVTTMCYTTKAHSECRGLLACDEAQGTGTYCMRPCAPLVVHRRVGIIRGRGGRLRGGRGGEYPEHYWTIRLRVHDGNRIALLRRQSAPRRKAIKKD